MSNTRTTIIHYNCATEQHITYKMQALTTFEPKLMNQA